METGFSSNRSDGFRTTEAESGRGKRAEPGEARTADGKREGAIEADNPELWQELKSNDIDGMIDELMRYKQA
ncbi:MAG: hypothetical protein AB7K24_08775, partial [Gemmataceae bacterium]